VSSLGAVTPSTKGLHRVKVTSSRHERHYEVNEVRSVTIGREVDRALEERDPGGNVAAERGMHPAQGQG
jgi:hypothetical protein